MLFRVKYTIYNIEILHCIEIYASLVLLKVYIKYTIISGLYLRIGGFHLGGFQRVPTRELTSLLLKYKVANILYLSYLILLLNITLSGSCPLFPLIREHFDF